MVTVVILGLVVGLLLMVARRWLRHRPRSQSLVDTVSAPLDQQGPVRRRDPWSGRHDPGGF